MRSRLPRALIADNDITLTVNRRAPRQVRMFSTAAQISVSQDPINRRTVLELVTGDRPGLLLQLGNLFEEHGVVLHNAKITTLGEKAEDVFFITTNENTPLDENHCEKLVNAIEAALLEPGAE